MTDGNVISAVPIYMVILSNNILISGGGLSYDISFHEVRRGAKVLPIPPYELYVNLDSAVLDENRI